MVSSPHLTQPSPAPPTSGAKTPPLAGTATYRPSRRCTLYGVGFEEILHEFDSNARSESLAAAWRSTERGDELRRGRYDGFDMAYHEFGDGPPLLFLHGIGNSSRLWLPYALGLADQYRCLVVDLPGFGRSRASTADVQIDRMSDILVAFLAEKEVLGSVVAVGHSMGALIAAHVAGVEPAALAGGVFVSGPLLSALDSYRHPFRSLVHSPRETISFYSLMLLGALPFVESVMTWAIGKRSLRRVLLKRFVNRIDELDADLARFMLGDLGNGRVLSTARNGFGYPYEEVYRSTSISPHVVVGDDDPIMSLDEGRRYLGMAKTGTLHVFERCGHLPMVERPGALRRVISLACS